MTNEDYEELQRLAWKPLVDLAVKIAKEHGPDSAHNLDMLAYGSCLVYKDTGKQCQVCLAISKMEAKND